MRKSAHVKDSSFRNEAETTAKQERAIQSKTMPFLNKTQITPLERAELGKWVADGAKLQ